MDRKAYWDEKYYEYWKGRVEESKDNTTTESNLIKGDVKTEGDEIYEEVFKKHPFHPGNILEVGCAWGRWFSIYQQYQLNIYGVDISKAMIDRAKTKWGHEQIVNSLQEAEAEDLPFDNEYFDNLTCLAVFDATYQDRALYEIFRVVKPGGVIYLTGKNDDYHDDDTLALDAEIGARKKGHPNYFTDVKAMIQQILNNNHNVIGAYFYPRRGDFALLAYEEAMPVKFYEYLLILRRGSKAYPFTSFSKAYSKTFIRSEIG